MSDLFHEDLKKIIVKLKNHDPGRVSLANIVTLCTIYGYETFVSEVTPKEQRLSIGGKVIFIDIDFMEDMKTVKDVTLVTSSNFDDFNLVNAAGESIILNSLTKYTRLNKFDAILEYLRLLETYSTQTCDLFRHYNEFYQSFPWENKKINEQDTFGFFLYSYDGRLLGKVCLLEREGASITVNGETINGLGYFLSNSDGVQLTSEFVAGETDDVDDLLKQLLFSSTKSEGTTFHMTLTNLFSQQLYTVTEPVRWDLRVAQQADFLMFLNKVVDTLLSKMNKSTRPRRNSEILSQQHRRSSVVMAHEHMVNPEDVRLNDLLQPVQLQQKVQTGLHVVLNEEFVTIGEETVSMDDPLSMWKECLVRLEREG